MRSDSTTPGHNMRYSDIVLDDPKMSLSAKGAFATLGLLGNDCSLTELAAHTSDGIEGTRAAVDELQGAGYVELSEDRVRLRRPGDFGVVG